MLATLTFVLLALLIIVVKLVLIVQMKEVCVIERLGKFRAVMQPGIHFLIPFFDRVAYRHETREQVLDIPSQSCISRDNIRINVDGLVYIQVMDGAKASYGIEDYRRASINLAQTTMRSEIGKLKLSQTFSERDALNETIVREIRILTEATAQGINMIAAAATKPGGDQAIRMRLLEQFIQQTGKILRTADVSVLPTEIAKLEGFFEGMDKVTQTAQGVK